MARKNGAPSYDRSESIGLSSGRIITAEPEPNKVFAYLLVLLHPDSALPPEFHTGREMAAPPTITENNALFLAQQATLKRSQQRSPNFLRRLGATWSIAKARFVRGPLLDGGKKPLSPR